MDVEEGGALAFNEGLGADFSVVGPAEGTFGHAVGAIPPEEPGTHVGVVRHADQGAPPLAGLLAHLQRRELLVREGGGLGAGGPVVLEAPGALVHAHGRVDPHEALPPRALLLVHGASRFQDLNLIFEVNFRRGNHDV